MACSIVVPSPLPMHLQQYCHWDSLETTALLLLTHCWQRNPLNTLSDTDANIQVHFTLYHRLFSSDQFSFYPSQYYAEPNHVLLFNVHLYLKKHASAELARPLCGQLRKQIQAVPKTTEPGTQKGAHAPSQVTVCPHQGRTRARRGHALRDRERTPPTGFSRTEHGPNAGSRS